MGNWAFEEYKRDMPTSELKESAAQLCGDTMSDLDAGIAVTSKGVQYRLVKYEDLVTNSTAVVAGIHAAMHVPVPLPVAWFVKENTKGGCKGKQDSWSTCRNATAVINKWRKQLSKEQIGVINGACTKVLKRMGYAQ